MNQVSSSLKMMQRMESSQRRSTEHRFGLLDNMRLLRDLK
jgi:hypothetical protein